MVHFYIRNQYIAKERAVDDFLSEVHNRISKVGPLLVLQISSWDKA